MKIREIFAKYRKIMRSIWTGDSQNAFFSTERFNKLRVMVTPEYEYSERTPKNGYYVLGIDVGRLDDQTEISVIKTVPQAMGNDMKTLVNLFTCQKMDFEDQSIFIKRLYYKYRARICVIDGNGMGIGLIDFMTKAQTDPKTGEHFPPFGIEGGTAKDTLDNYKNIKGGDVEENAIYIMKANHVINTEAFSYVQSQLMNSKIRFLIDEQKAKSNYMSTAKGQKASLSQRADYLLPYQQTSMLREQMANLTSENDGVNIILKQSTKNIKKDKFSSFCYGLYYIKKQEDKRRRGKRIDIASMMFFS
jgi:hypothetical protein